MYISILKMGLNVKNIRDRKSTRLNSSHLGISYAVFCLKKKKIALDTANYAHRIVDCFRMHAPACVDPVSRRVRPVTSASLRLQAHCVCLGVLVLGLLSI